MLDFIFSSIFGSIPDFSIPDSIFRAVDTAPYGNGRILGIGYDGEIIYDTSDPLPDHDLLIEDLGVSPIDDHNTCGC